MTSRSIFEHVDLNSGFLGGFSVYLPRPKVEGTEVYCIKTLMGKTSPGGMIAFLYNQQKIRKSSVCGRKNKWKCQVQDGYNKKYSNEAYRTINE